MNYVDPAPDDSYYCMDFMHESERKDFLAWYETAGKKEIFENKRVFESYFPDVTVF
jgi:hypothetical protein